MDNTTPIKVRVKTGLSTMLAVQRYEGQILEVVKDGYDYYRLSDAEKERVRRAGQDDSFSIDANNVEVVEENTSSSELEQVMSLLGRIQKATKNNGSEKYGYPHLALYSDGSGAVRQERGGNRVEELVHFNRSKNNHIAVLTKFVEELEEKNREVSVQLNDTYTAVVKGDNIEVGCQTIPVAKVRELLEAIDKKGSRVGQKVKFCDVREGEKIRFDYNSTVYTRNGKSGRTGTLTFINYDGKVRDADCDSTFEDIVTIVE